MAKRSRPQSSSGRSNRTDRERRRTASIPPHLSSPRSTLTRTAEGLQLSGDTHGARFNRVPAPISADPKEYNYVRRDMIRIGTLSGAIFVFMAVLALWMR